MTMTDLLHFEHRSYSGRQFRPRPEIHFDRDNQLLLVATPWGPRQSARKVIDCILDYYVLARSDQEVTSPFEKLSCLSMAANHLRTATLLANQLLYREDNRDEYRVGVELFGASFVDHELVWLQAGQPSIVLARQTGKVVSLGGSTDLAFDLSSSNELLPALPSQLLGLDSSINFTINSFRPYDRDRLILMSHSCLPASIYSTGYESMQLDELVRSLARTDPETAFWLGVLEFQMPLGQAGERP